MRSRFFTEKFPKLFAEWDEMRVRGFSQCVKERYLTEGEFLLRDCQQADCIYFVIQGTLRIEKEVDLYKRNQWPANKQNRLQRTVKNSVLYKV